MQAVLHFEKSAGAGRAAGLRNFIRSAILQERRVPGGAIAIPDFFLLIERVREPVLHHGGELGLRGITKNAEIRAGFFASGQQPIRIHFGEATGSHREPRARFAQDLRGFPIGVIGHGTGVEKVKVGRGTLAHGRTAERAEIRFERVRVGKVRLATHVGDREGEAIAKHSHRPLSRSTRRPTTISPW